MPIARTTTPLVVCLLLPWAGCALPHANVGRQDAAASRRAADSSDRGETLIRVDHEGNVYRQGESSSDALPSDTETSPTTSARRKAEKQVASQTEISSPENFQELAKAIDEPQVDAQRIEELVAAHERSAASSPTAEQKSIAVQTAAAIPATGPAVAQAVVTTVAAPPAPSPAVSLPPGIFPTVVRTTRFELEYDDQVLGEGKIAKVELYGTRDAGRTWDKLGEDADCRSPYTVEMPDEGVFGFRIAVAGNNGLASRPPKSGELPELWVRVDLSEPIFRANLRPAGETIAAGDAPPASASPSDRVIAEATAEGAKPKIEQSPVAQVSHVEPIAAQPLQPSDWKSHLAEAIAAAESRLQPAKSDDANAVPPLSDEERQQLSAHLRMLYLAAGRHDDAIKSSIHHDTPQNEFWSHQMHGLKLLTESTPAPAARQASSALAELRQASDKLAAASQLQVKNLTFCTAANSFGVYETTIAGSDWKNNDYSKRKFEPEQPIVLYFEVDNFASEQTTSREFPDGAWRTSLRGSYTIVDAAGSPVEQRELKLKDDLCRNRRHDYYVAYMSWIPKLNPGRYSLELLVEDTIAKKIGTSSIDFEVVAK